MTQTHDGLLLPGKRFTSGRLEDEGTASGRNLEVAGQIRGGRDPAGRSGPGIIAREI